MPFFHIVLLALIQGLTELLPVSSSAHLGLFHCFADQCAGWDAENLAMDVAVHVGTLFAVLFYFRHDVLKMIMGGLNITRGRVKEDNSRLVQYVLLSSVPVIIAGFALKYFQPDWLKTIHTMAWTLIIFGIVLWYADKKSPVTKHVDHMSYKDALIIGLAQMLALVPGVSRSGITMTAARSLGYSRLESARYSMFMAMVAISGAGILIGLDMLKGTTEIPVTNVLIAIVFSFFSSWAALIILMNMLGKWSFKPFAIYRVVLGTILLALIYSGIIA